MDHPMHVCETEGLQRAEHSVEERMCNNGCEVLGTLCPEENMLNRGCDPVWTMNAAT